MGDAVGEGFELANGFLELGGAFGDEGFEIIPGLAQFIFQASSDGDILGDFDKAAEIALGIVHAAEDFGDENGDAILANEPEFIRADAVTDDVVAFALGNARFASFRGIEAGEILADDFFFRIAEEPFGPGIPILDDAGNIYAEEGEILDAIQEQAVAHLALSELLFAAFLLGDIVGDLEKATVLAGFGAQGPDGASDKQAAAIFPDMPADIRAVAFALGVFDFLRRSAGRAVFRNEDGGEILADNFLGIVAKEFHGAAAPTGNFTFRIDGKNGVILRAINEHAQPLLGLFEAALDLLLALVFGMRPAGTGPIVGA